MEHRVKVTVLDKKLFPELQAQYCAVPDSGKCPCYSVGDEFMFYRNDERDDFWHMKRSMAAALRNRNYLVLESAVWYYMLVLFTMGEIICSLRWMR